MRLRCSVSLRRCRSRAARRGWTRAAADPRTRVRARRSISRATGCRSSPKTGSSAWSRRKKGVYDSLMLNAEGRRVADTWDPARDEAAGEQCRAYGAANIMRIPGRVHITWQDDNTLRLDADAGTQTRLFVFGAAPATSEPSWQGQSIAEWQDAPAARGAVRTGNLKVMTTNLRSGYVRRNGAPYSAKTDGDRILRSQRDAQRRSLVHRHDEGRGSGLFTRTLSDDDGFQEAARCVGMESDAVLGALTSAARRTPHPQISLRS